MSAMTDKIVALEAKINENIGNTVFDMLIELLHDIDAELITIKDGGSLASIPTPETQPEAEPNTESATTSEVNQQVQGE